MNKKLRDALPYFKAAKELTATSGMKKFATVKGSKCLLKFLNDADQAKLSPRETDKIIKTKDFLNSVKVFNEFCRTATDKYATTPEVLAEHAKRMWRLEKFADTIPWDLYKRAYPELAAKRSSKLGSKKDPRNGMPVVLEIISDIAQCADIRSRKGGFFADRLLTALCLGTPFERIKESPEINLPVALKVLQEFYPGINEDSIRMSTDISNLEHYQKAGLTGVYCVHAPKDCLFDETTLKKLGEATSKILEESGHYGKKGNANTVVTYGRLPF